MQKLIDQPDSEWTTLQNEILVTFYFRITINSAVIERFALIFIISGESSLAKLQKLQLPSTIFRCEVTALYAIFMHPYAVHKAR